VLSLYTTANCASEENVENVLSYQVILACIFTKTTRAYFYFWYCKATLKVIFIVCPLCIKYK